jgi:hypothetical protein
MNAKKVVLPKRELRGIPISVRVTPSLRAALEQAAAEDVRSVSQVIALALEAAMRERGYLK